MSPQVPSWVVRWCQRELGAVPVGVLFSVEAVSAVVGIALDDGRRVVVPAPTSPGGPWRAWPRSWRPPRRVCRARDR